MNTLEVIKDWMEKCRSTIENYDLAGHMNLISEQVQVFGIEGYDVIKYKDWFAQCEHEFKDKIIASVEYNSLKIKHESTTKIVFLTIEIIKATDGKENKNGVEVELSKEDDGQWRVTQERVLDIKESRSEGLPL